MSPQLLPPPPRGDHLNTLVLRPKAYIVFNANEDGQHDKH